MIFSLIIAVAAAALIVDLIRSDSSQPETSAVENIAIEDSQITYKTDYFTFQDTNKWVLDKRTSSKTKFIYTSFRGVMPQYQLAIYVNEKPIPLYTTVSRILPVRLVGGSTLDVTNVYGPCISEYKPGELHKVKTVTIQGAQMLCDPDTPQYSVVLSEVNGDWQLDMKRADGSVANYTIIYHDLTFDPSPDTILHIAKTFKSQ